MTHVSDPSPLSQPLKPIGVYGGTFDPIHYGHLRPNLELCEFFDMQEVRFIPAFIPPHREAPASSAQLRREMVALAIASEVRFILDERELQRGGPSYMVDTLKSLRADFPDNPLCLLLGMDAFLGINHWYHWQELLDYAHIIVSQRPDSGFEQPQHWPQEIADFYQHNKGDKEQVQNHLQGVISLQPVTQLAISATDIRNRLKNHQSVRYLMPDNVINLIEYHHLYT